MAAIGLASRADSVRRERLVTSLFRLRLARVVGGLAVAPAVADEPGGFVSQGKGS